MSIGTSQNQARRRSSPPSAEITQNQENNDSRRGASVKNKELTRCDEGSVSKVSSVYSSHDSRHARQLTIASQSTLARRSPASRLTLARLTPPEQLPPRLAKRLELARLVGPELDIRPRDLVEAVLGPLCPADEGCAPVPWQNGQQVWELVCWWFHGGWSSAQLV